MIVPLVTARIVDIGIQNRDIPYIWKMAALLVAFGVMGLLCSLLAQYFAAKAAVGFGTELRHDLFCHIEQLSYAAVDKAGSATLVVRITSDIQSGTVRCQSGASSVPAIAVYCGRCNGHGIYDQCKMARLFVAAIVVLFIIVFGVMKLTAPLYRRTQQKLDKITEATRKI